MLATRLPLLSSIPQINRCFLSVNLIHRRRIVSKGKHFCKPESFKRIMASKSLTEMTSGRSITGDGQDCAAAVQSPWDLKRYMAEKVGAVNEALDGAVSIQYPEKIHEAMKFSLCGGGKRLCSVVSIAACELFGGSQDAVMPIACALEMIHDASQVHDDLPCMDNSALRRGRPTIHVAFGEDTAVLTADALLCRAFELIAKETKGVSPEKLLRVIAHIARSVGSEGMVAGQFVDLESTANPSTSLATVEFIHLHKTAILVESSIVSGAIVGGASDEDVERLAEYGRTLGLLFQVVDDVLDVTKSAEELGKPAGVDALTDKATYPKFLGVEKTKLYALELLAKANEQISKFDPVKAAPLIAMAEFVINRPR